MPALSRGSVSSRCLLLEPIGYQASPMRAARRRAGPASPTDPDRRVRLLDRLGFQDDAVELRVTALEARCTLGPQHTAIRYETRQATTFSTYVPPRTLIVPPATTRGERGSWSGTDTLGRHSQCYAAALSSTLATESTARADPLILDNSAVVGVAHGRRCRCRTLGHIGDSMAMSYTLACAPMPHVLPVKVRFPPSSTQPLVP